jgi:hypothetical protein
MVVAQVNLGTCFAHIAIVSKVCCKHCFKMFHLSLDDVAIVLSF